MRIVVMVFSALPLVAQEEVPATWDYEITAGWANLSGREHTVSSQTSLGLTLTRSLGKRDYFRVGLYGQFADFEAWSDPLSGWDLRQTVLGGLFGTDYGWGRMNIGLGLSHFAEQRATQRYSSETIPHRQGVTIGLDHLGPEMMASFRIDLPGGLGLMTRFNTFLGTIETDIRSDPSWSENKPGITTFALHYSWPPRTRR